MRTFIITFLFVSNIHAAEKYLMLSDTYTETLREEIKLFWGEDAFKKDPGFVEAKKEAELPSLSAIMYDPDNPLAVVNGNPVGLGAKVDGRNVIEIGKQHILLQKGNSIIEVQLGENKKSKRDKKQTNIRKLKKENLAESILKKLGR